MRFIIGSLALASTMAIAATTSADTYHYTALGDMGPTGFEFSVSATITDTVVDEWQDGDFGLYVVYESSDVVFQVNGAITDTSNFKYTQFSEGLAGGTITYGVHVSFAIGLFDEILYEVDFGDYVDPEDLHAYSNLTGGGTFSEPVMPIEILSASLVPVPGLSALAPLAGIAAIRRRRRR